MCSGLHRSLLGAFVFGIAVLYIVVAGDRSAAQDKAKTIKGKLINYDDERKLIKVTKGSGAATLIVAKDVKFTIDDEPTDRKLADLKPETAVELTLNSDKTIAIAVNAEGSEVKRYVDAVDLEKGTLRVHLAKKEETFTFDKDVPVFNGKKIKAGLDEIKPGVFVSLQLSLDRTKVTEIHLVPPPKSK